jgi:hypothetical protein
MKKAIVGIISAAMIFSASIGVFAVNSTVSIENGEKNVAPVTYTYDSEKAGETVKTIKSLMTNLSDLTDEHTITQTFTIISESAGAKPVEMKLRLSMPQESTMQPAMTADDYSALEYYNIKITDDEGKVIYPKEDNNIKDKTAYRDISLGTLNKLSGSESQKYNVEVSVNKEFNRASVKRAAEKLDWSIVSNTYVQQSTPAPVPSESTITPAPLVTVVPATQTPAPNVSENKNGVITVSAGEYICGEDIPQGRYTMTGSGKVRVYKEGGGLKATVVLKNKGDKANGSEEYIINLLDGEKVVADSEIKLTPNASATPTPKSTKSSTVKATATPKAGTNSKTNPKTGDAAPIALVSIVGILAIGAVVVIEIKKRREF